MSDELCFKVRPDLLVEVVDGECVILDMERNVYFGLEPVARAIWQMLEQGQSVSEVIATLTAKYGQSEQITQDVHAFIAQVESRGLLTRA